MTGDEIAHKGAEVFKKLLELHTPTLHLDEYNSSEGALEFAYYCEACGELFPCETAQLVRDFFEGKDNDGTEPAGQAVVGD